MAAAAGWGIRHSFGPHSPILIAVLVLGLYGIVYFGVTWSLGLAEARAFVKGATRRISSR